MASKKFNVMQAKSLLMESHAFNSTAFMQEYYTAKGANINPPVKIKRLPEQAQALALEISNPTAPVRPWIHWLVWNIPALGSSVKIKADSSPGSTTWNDLGQMGYTGPLNNNKSNTLTIKAFALKTFLPDTCGSPLHQVFKSIYNNQIASNELTCFYKPAAQVKAVEEGLFREACQDYLVTD